MIEQTLSADGRTWRLTAAMTQAQAATLRITGQNLLLAGPATDPVRIDLGEVSAADSCGLAVLLDWLRLASRQGRTLTIEKTPQGLRSLAELYGIDGLLNLA